MYRDFLTVMLINLTAGFFLLAHFAYRGLALLGPARRSLSMADVEEGDLAVREAVDYRPWTPGFALIGFVAVLTGAVMMFTWPLPGSNNIPFGEGSFLFGAIFLAVAFTFARRMGLESLAVFTFFAGIVAIVLGARIANLGLTNRPGLSATGFIFSGLAALLASACLAFPRLRANWFVRIALAAVVVVAGVIWAITAFDAYWGHLATFKTWKPPA